MRKNIILCIIKGFWKFRTEFLFQEACCMLSNAFLYLSNDSYLWHEAQGYLQEFVFVYLYGIAKKLSCVDCGYGCTSYISLSGN